MLYTILTIVITLFVMDWLHPNRIRPIFGVYRQPDHWYPFKFAIVYAALVIRKYLDKKSLATNRKDSNSTRGGYGVQMKAKIEELDCPQPLPPNAQLAVDAVYFVGASRNGTYFVAATARRPDNVIDGFWLLRIPGVGLLKSPKSPDSLLRAVKDMTYGADGLLIESVRPMREWHITYEGKMKLESPKEELLHVKWDFTWTSDLPYFNFDTDVPPETLARAIAKEPWSRSYFRKLEQSHQTHHEQMGVIKGTVEVENHGKYDILLNSMRDHSIAKMRDWKLMHRYGLHSVTVDDGTKFCVGIISQPSTFSTFEMGYLYTPDGELHGVERCDLQLYRHGEGGTPPVDYSFTFRAGGKDYLVECEIVEAPEIFIGHEWEARVVERMGKFKVNGKDGWGFAEWEYRHHGGRPPILTT